MDAAILFADILLPVIPLGRGLGICQRRRPADLQHPVRTLEDVQALSPVDPETDLGYVMRAIRILRGELRETPLIGFCGAPFTVASYMIEGGSSRDFLKTKTMMYSEPQTWHALMDKLTHGAERLFAGTNSRRSAGRAGVRIRGWARSTRQTTSNLSSLIRGRILQAAQAADVPVIHFGTKRHFSFACDEGGGRDGDRSRLAHSAG